MFNNNNKCIFFKIGKSHKTIKNKKLRQKLKIIKKKNWHFYEKIVFFYFYQKYKSFPYCLKHC